MTANYARSDNECEEFIARGLSHYHIIPLNDRVKTPGRVDRTVELDLIGLTPADMAGRDALDIGALDGVLAFHCERFGARRVLALDVEDMEKYDWGWDGAPAHYRGMGNLKNRVFTELHSFFGSQVERKAKTVYDLSLAADGAFDFVFFYGVLYHLRHPLLSLDRIRSVCKGAAIVETHICNRQRHLPQSLFYLDNVLDNAETNWTGPSESCVVHWMRDAGFKQVWAQKTTPTHNRQRFIGFIDEPTFKVNEKAFALCDAGYFERSRENIRQYLGLAPQVASPAKRGLIQRLMLRS